MNIKSPNSHIIYTFPTPILQLKHPEAEKMNSSLMDVILQQEQLIPSEQRSNYGGWHSPSDLLTWEFPVIDELNSWIKYGLNYLVESFAKTNQFQCKYSIAAWANVNREGQANKMHIHPNNHWSGVYYVQNGDDAQEDMGGEIVFVDPRPGASMLPQPNFSLSNDIIVKPEAGLLLMFPSWLLHGVLPFKGTGERISIAFNVAMKSIDVNS